MTADEVRQEIEQTRKHLGQTVDELAFRADMKARARARAAAAKERVRSKVAQVPGQVRQSQAVRRHWPVAMTAGGLVIGAVAIWQRRKQA